MSGGLMSSLTADLTLADCDSHIVYWQTKRAQASEQRDRKHADERLNAWLEERHKISEQTTATARAAKPDRSSPRR